MIIIESITVFVVSFLIIRWLLGRKPTPVKTSASVPTTASRVLRCRHCGGETFRILALRNKATGRYSMDPECLTCGEELAGELTVTQDTRELKVGRDA